MKALKGFFFFFMVLILFFVVELSMVNYALNKTIFSGIYFSKTFDRSKMDSIIGEFVVGEISKGKAEDNKSEDNMKQNNKDNKGPDIGVILAKYMDKSWLNQQGALLIKGIQSYVAGDSDKLPVIYIEPLKNSFIDGAAEEIMKEGKIKDKEMAKAMAAKALKLDSVKDSVDINMVMERASTNDKNPLKNLRDMIRIYQKIIFRTLFLIVALLIAIISVVNFNLMRSLRLISVGGISAGVVGIALGLIGKFSPLSKSLSENITMGMKMDSQAEAIVTLQKWVDSFLKGYFNILLIEGTIIAVITIISIIVFRKFSKVETDTIVKKKKVAVIISRILITLILMVAIKITIMWAVADGKTAVSTFKAGNINFNMMKGLSEVSGMKLSE